MATGIRSKSSGLPLDNASEAWMDDDVGIIDSEDEDEAIHGDIGVVENKENVQQARQIKVDETDTKVSRNTTKSGNSCLTLDDTSEAWMDDDVGTIDSDSEDEANVKKDKTEKHGESSIIIEKIEKVKEISNFTTEVKESTVEIKESTEKRSKDDNLKTVAPGLPMDEIS